MPNIKSAKKRMKQSEKRRIHNRNTVIPIRTIKKEINEAIAQNDKTKALKIFKEYEKKLDTATRKGVFHRNTTARNKSRLLKKISSLAVSAKSNEPQTETPANTDA